MKMCDGVSHWIEVTLKFTGCSDQRVGVKREQKEAHHLENA